MKAMILAAGRGERMKPLTETTPKPLLKVGGVTLIERHLKTLRDAGVREVIVNVSYAVDQFHEVLGDGKKFNVKVHYSYELEGPIGTGGGIYKALSFLGNEPFILVSGDIWTDFPFETLVHKSISDAHLILVENPDFHPKGDFGLGPHNIITETPQFTYASMAVIHPRLFRNQKSGVFPLAPLFSAAIRQGNVTGELYRGNWYNIGTPEQLELLRKTLPNFA